MRNLGFANVLRRFCVCINKRAIALIFLILLSFTFAPTRAKASEYFIATATNGTYEPTSRNHSDKEILFDATFSYVMLWVGYAASQYDVVQKITLDDLDENLFEEGPVLWDGDNAAINFIGHPWYGSEFYLYYRSRGYSVKSSLLGLTLSNIAFEFLVESTSQPPSTNDIIVTTAIGGLFGYYREIFAIKLLNSGGKGGRILGHILWPETMFGFFENFVVVPAVGEKDGKFSGGIQFALKF